jgi:sugar/nucleoside kinase (ribokinase family)
MLVSGDDDVRGKTVSCIGLLSPSLLARVDRQPRVNEHAYYRDMSLVPGTDAAIVAATLGQWDVRVQLFGNPVGRDAIGQQFVDLLRAHGISGGWCVRDDIVTPCEFVFTDDSDARLWYSPERTAGPFEVDMDLRPIKSSAFLYTDWYAGEYAATAIETATREQVPLLLNLGHSAWTSAAMPSHAARAAIVQASCDERRDARVAESMLAAVRNTCPTSLIVITHGRHGCLASHGDLRYRVVPPRIDVIDTNGAGATFSAGLIYGALSSWGIEEQLQFATAAAALKCGMRGVATHSVAEVFNTLGRPTG